MMNERTVGYVGLLVLNMACGGVSFDAPDGAKTPDREQTEVKTEAELAPGFYDVKPEPAATAFGNARVSVTGSSTFVLSLDAPRLARDARFYVAVKVPGDAPHVASPTALVADGKVAFSVAAKGADATLLVYLQREGTSAADTALDELVGTSWIPSAEHLGYLVSNSWRLNATNQAEQFDGQSPIRLRHAPDLQFALCDEERVGDTLCGKPIFSGVRAYGMAVMAYRDRGRCGGAALRADLQVYMLQPALRERSTIEVNGAPYEPQKTEWKTDNVVRITVPGLPAWTARVILPSVIPVPILGEPELRVGSPFTVTWDAAAWATKYTVGLLPNGLPVGRIVYPRYETQEPRLDEVFNGFGNPGSVGQVGPTANLTLSTALEQDLNGGGAQSYMLSVHETTTVVTKAKD